MFLQVCYIRISCGSFVIFEDWLPNLIDHGIIGHGTKCCGYPRYTIKLLTVDKADIVFFLKSGGIQARPLEAEQSLTDGVTQKMR